MNIDFFGFAPGLPFAPAPTIGAGFSRCRLPAHALIHQHAPRAVPRFDSEQRGRVAAHSAPSHIRSLTGQLGLFLDDGDVCLYGREPKLSTYLSLISSVPTFFRGERSDLTRNPDLNLLRVA